MKDAVFRAGTGAVIWRGPTEVLAFERAVPSGGWQLPQGGLYRGESPEAGVWRELLEETGLGPAEVELRYAAPEWLAYEIPVGQRRDHRLGQVQRWFHFSVLDDDVEPHPDQLEFVAWAWVEASELIDRVIAFKKSVYRTVLGGGRPF